LDSFNRISLKQILIFTYKNKIKTNMAKEFSFADLNKEMSKHSTYGETLDKSTISEIDHYIPTGNWHLNACLTGSLFGGYPNNRAVALAGPSGTGKTYLILNAIKQAQLQGYSIVFYDSENAVDKTLVEKFGIDPKKFRYEPCNTVQEFRTSVTAITDVLIEQKKKGIALPKIMVVLDSAGNLATQKEIDDAKTGSSKADMTRAKLLKSTFRIIMTQFGICKIPFLFTNHTYQTQDLFSRQVGGGGTGPEYAASIILFLGKAKLKEGIEQTGIIVTAKPNKNRFAKPTNIKFHISFNKGMNPYIGLEEYISWDTCGVERGRFINANAYNKLTDPGKAECREHTYEKDGKEVTIYFQPAATARKICVKHLNDTVELNQLFTPEVLTEDVLKALEPIVAAKFKYGEEIDVEDLTEMLEADVEEKS
jgi:RecA/RadA recombinase